MNMFGINKLSIVYALAQHTSIFLMVTAVATGCPHEDNKTAICTAQNFDEIPIHLPQSIKNLILSNNNISNISMEIVKQYSQIRQLNLDYNQIRSSNSIKAVSVLRELRILSVSGNKLLVLNFQIFRMNLHLEEIIADNNPGVYIKETPVTLSKLERISLKYNKLDSFPVNAFRGFYNLKILDLRYNELHYLPKNTDAVLPNLIQLYVSGNHIIHLEQRLLPKSDLPFPTELPVNNSITEEMEQNENKLTTRYEGISDLDEDHSTTLPSAVNRITNVKPPMSSSSQTEFFSSTTMKTVSKENDQLVFRKVLLYAIYAFVAVNVVLLVIGICLGCLNFVIYRHANVVAHE